MQLNLDQVVDEHIAAHAKLAPHVAAGPKIDRAATLAKLQDILAQLQAKGITLLSVLQFVKPILEAITAGTPSGAIVSGILALLGGAAGS